MWIQSLGQEDSPRRGNGNPLHYFCLENPTDRGAWWAIVHGVTKSWTWLSTNYSTVEPMLVSSCLKSRMLDFSIEEGNGTPLQYSRLENPRDGIPWLQSMGSLAVGHDFTFTVQFRALEKEMATHSSVPAWRIPGMRGAWWSAVYGVAQSQTWLKRLSSSSSMEGCTCHECAWIRPEGMEGQCSGPAPGVVASDDRPLLTSLPESGLGAPCPQATSIFASSGLLLTLLPHPPTAVLSRGILLQKWKHVKGEDS